MELGVHRGTDLPGSARGPPVNRRSNRRSYCLQVVVAWAVGLNPAFLALRERGTSGSTPIRIGTFPTSNKRPRR
jgi:hypothetical protein